MRYRVMDDLADGGSDRTAVARLLEAHLFHFTLENSWVRQVLAWARSGAPR